MNKKTLAILNKILEYGICLFVFLLPWQARYIFSVGQIQGAPSEYGTISFYVTEVLLCLLLLLSFTIHLFDHNEENHYRGRKVLNISLSAIVLVIISFAELFFAINTGIAFLGAVRLLEGVGLMLMLVHAVVSVHRLGWMVLSSAALQSLIGIYQFAQQKISASTILGMSAKLPADKGISVVEAAGQRLLRAYGTFDHPNILAAFLVIALAIAMALFMSYRNLPEKIFLSAATVLITAGVFFTFSRTAFLALGLMLVIVGIYLLANKNKLLIKEYLIALLLIFAPLGLLTFSYWPIVSEHYLNPEKIMQSDSVTQRLDYFNDTREILKEYWYKGTGINNYTISLANLEKKSSGFDFQPVHNVIMLVLAELGVIGGIIFLSILFETIRTISRFKAEYNDGVLSELEKYENGSIYKRDYGYVTYWYVAFCGLLIGLIAWMFFDHFFWTLYTGVMMWWLSMGLWMKMLVRVKN